MIVAELLLHQEFVSQLTQGVYSIQSHIQIVVLPHIIEVFAQALPDLLPHKPDAVHVIVGYLD
jgi:hypothetical protein